MVSEHLVALTIGLAFVVAAIGYAGIYNQVQRFRNIIPETMSNIAVLRQKRTDLIAKLISIVDSYGAHEGGIASKVASEFGGASRLDNSSRMVERLASLRMAFPDLKADSLYENLMQELAQVETDIAKRREQYNSVVRAYNTSISQFPANLLLIPFRFKPERFLEDLPA
jgi:LemA protein